MSKHVYIITGASSGLGAALSRLLLSEETLVFGLSRTVNREIQQLAQDLKANYQFIAADLTQVERIEATFREIIESLDSSKIETITLINNAATVTPIKPIEACLPDEIVSSIQLNLTAPILLTSSFMKETANWAAQRAIVNISSGSGQYPASSMSVYCSSKAALNMFTKCVAMEQNKEGNPVLMLTIDPGMMNTGMQQIARESDFELSAYFRKQNEEGNLAEPVTVARNILLELSRHLNSSLA
ncbi:SDR family NAD(P)-dependent oxidoreductase [Paenibacillus qinlingensis]|uniref:SDR family NAD(P)-dependent oxidoreductase n=1 Tax=Paenibacillus qinlingensis TaxID=1837343 RepID=UPI001567968E|nr:SDR family NAD(P)-dependent oxidoreductase [Paenibacillus qinlingensis]NQX58364.1 SDR family NAD(P)-dependent oxidoreductase [Paenibacillus qinlingensis]